MMRLKSVIVDDERLARKELRSLLEEITEVSVVGEAKNLAESVELIEKERPDVVFLDIQLKHESGFDLLERVEHGFKVIFVTAFDRFAIRAFEVNALDYLLKPVNPKRLEGAIERLLDHSAPRKSEDLRNFEIDDRLFLEVNERSVFVQISDISHICASGDYTEIYLENSKKYLIEKPLREWEQRLPQKHFMRIHRSTIINLNNIETMESLFNRTIEVSLRNYERLFTVSRRYASMLKERFG